MRKTKITFAFEICALENWKCKNLIHSERRKEGKKGRKGGKGRKGREENIGESLLWSATKEVIDENFMNPGSIFAWISCELCLDIGITGKVLSGRSTWPTPWLSTVVPSYLPSENNIYFSLVKGMKICPLCLPSLSV